MGGRVFSLLRRHLPPVVTFALAPLARRVNGIRISDRNVDRLLSCSIVVAMALTWPVCDPQHSPANNLAECRDVELSGGSSSSAAAAGRH